jgi:mRNA interferase HigB
VHIVTRKHLSDVIKLHPSVADEIEAWTRIVEAARWHNFLEVSSMFKDADNVNGYVVFNIRRNRYRLITVITLCEGSDRRPCLHQVFSDAQGV